MMRARGIVLAGIVVAGLLGVNVQAGTVLDEPDDSALGWWSEGAGDEGIGSAPLPMPVADCGDWSPRRGSLYGAIRRTPPHRAVVPPVGWGWRADVFPANGEIEVLAAGGSQAQTTAGYLTVWAPSDVSDISTVFLGGANIMLWSGTVFSLSDGGTVTQGGYSMTLAGGDLAYAGGSLVFWGGGSISSTAPGVFDLTDGGIFTPGVIFDGSLWTVGPGGTLAPVVNTLSPVPEPGSLAMAGLGIFLAAWLVPKGRRGSIFCPRAIGEN